MQADAGMIFASCDPRRWLLSSAVGEEFRDKKVQKLLKATLLQDPYGGQVKALRYCRDAYNERHCMHCVLDLSNHASRGQVWLGGVAASSNANLLEEARVSDIWPASYEREATKDGRFFIHPITDGTGVISSEYPLDPILQRVNEVAKKVLQGAVLLVCCRNGAHRSSLIVLIILIFMTGRRPGEIAEYLQQIRNIVDLWSSPPRRRDLNGLRFCEQVYDRVCRHQRSCNFPLVQLNEVMTPQQYWAMARTMEIKLPETIPAQVIKACMEGRVSVSDSSSSTGRRPGEEEGKGGKGSKPAWRPKQKALPKAQPDPEARGKIDALLQERASAHDASSVGAEQAETLPERADAPASAAPEERPAAKPEPATDTEEKAGVAEPAAEVADRVKPAEQASAAPVSYFSADNLTCYPCNVTCSTFEHMTAHVMSTAHIRKMQAAVNAAKAKAAAAPSAASTAEAETATSHSAAVKPEAAAESEPVPVAKEEVGAKRKDAPEVQAEEAKKVKGGTEEVLKEVFLSLRSMRRRVKEAGRSSASSASAGPSSFEDEVDYGGEEEDDEELQQTAKAVASNEATTKEVLDLLFAEQRKLNERLDLILQRQGQDEPVAEVADRVEALWAALRNRNLAEVDAVMRDLPDDVLKGMRDSAGMNPLHLVARERWYGFTYTLVGRCPSLCNEVSGQRQPPNWTALMSLANMPKAPGEAKREAEVVAVLLQAMSSTAISTQSGTGATCTHLAVSKGNLELVRQVLWELWSRDRRLPQQHLSLPNATGKSAVDVAWKNNSDFACYLQDYWGGPVYTNRPDYDERSYSYARRKGKGKGR